MEQRLCKECNKSYKPWTTPRDNKGLFCSRICLGINRTKDYSSQNYRKVRGLGICDADYATSKYEVVGKLPSGQPKTKLVWRCPFFSKWIDLLRRVSDKTGKMPSYSDVTVCEDWLLFTTFKAWMETQDWEGKHLDKDILIPGNKIYSPETCLFVEPRINIFFSKRGHKKDTTLPLGVCRSATGYKAQWSEPLGTKGKNTSSPVVKTVHEAHKIYLAKKYLHCVQLSYTQEDIRVIKALWDRAEDYYRQLEAVSETDCWEQ